MFNFDGGTVLKVVERGSLRTFDRVMDLCEIKGSYKIKIASLYKTSGNIWIDVKDSCIIFIFLLNKYHTFGP